MIWQNKISSCWNINTKVASWFGWNCAYILPKFCFLVSVDIFKNLALLKRMFHQWNCWKHAFIQFFSTNLSIWQIHLGHFQHFQIFAHIWDTYHQINDLCIINWRKRKTLLFSASGAHMNSVNGQNIMRIFFKIVHLSHFFQFFYKFIAMVYADRKFWNTELYSSQIKIKPRNLGLWQSSIFFVESRFRLFKIVYRT